MKPPPSLPLPQGTHRPTIAVIDLDALAHNLQEIRRLLPTRTAVCAVVKANAYGHGAVPVSRELEALGVESFAVATVEEGVELRQAGIRKPILVLGIGESGTGAAVEHGLTTVIYSEASARRVMEAARETDRDVPVHIKLDTGMGRIGLFPEEWPSLVRELLEIRNIRLEGYLTHFSSAESDPGFTRTQTERFKQALDEVQRLSACGRKQVHIANSAGILAPQEAVGNMVRPGIILYGAYPDPGLMDRASLRPVMTFRTEVLYLKTLPPGSPVSYGQTFHTRRTSRIATLPVGYADGYRRDLSNRGVVLIHGKTAPVVGTVTMDLIMADVTDLPGVREGDEVTLFGCAGEETLRADELAAKIGTIPYELLCAVSRRVPRVYLKGGRVVDVRGEGAAEQKPARPTTHA
jgi:alanine racemase